MLAGNHRCGALCLANPKTHRKRTDTHPNAVAALEARYLRKREAHAQVLAELEAHPALREFGRAERGKKRAEKGMRAGAPLDEGIVKTAALNQAKGNFEQGNASFLAGRMCC